MKLIPEGEKFAAVKKIFMIVPYDSQKLLIGTRPDGFFVHDKKRMEPFPTEADEYLNEKKVYQGIRLSNGDLALATLFGGLVVLDPHGRIKHIFDKSCGLQDDDVKCVFEDNQGNLWLTLNKGISKIEYTSSISIHDERSNLPGLVLSMVRHDNVLYVGTTNGLYYLKSPLKFHPIPGIAGICWSLCSSEDSLLAATAGGVFHVKMNIKQPVIKDPSYVLFLSKHYPGRTWCGTSQGLTALLFKNGQWMEEHRFDDIRQEIRSITEDQKGNVWLGTLSGNVFKVESPVNVNQAYVTRYDTSHGLPKGEIYAARAAGHVMFATEQGLFRFNEKSNTFIPDGTLGKEFAGGSHSRPVFRLVEDKNKNIWFHSEGRNHQAVPAAGKAYKIYSRPFLRIPIMQVNAIYPAPNGTTIWFASFEGLIRFDTKVNKDYNLNFQAVIRRVVINGKLIFDGCEYIRSSKRLIPAIDYKDRKNLHFEFAAPFFEAEASTQYRYFLEGHDGNWSEWSSECKMDFTTLDPGLYTFRVRARNVYGNVSSEGVFQFKILPPWYQTWWAFIIYVVLFFALMFLGIKWRSRRLEQEKQRLERLVKARTKEVYHKNEQLEEQSQKLKEMDRVKSRFFANISHEFRTPITLIMGPLEQMLAGSESRQQRENVNMMLRNSRRLLRLINQLLDLSRFDSGKMKLQAARQNIVPFIKGTLASFHMLAQQNRLTLECCSEKEDISLYFDARNMEEVMYNLLINAVKFTPANGKITVSVSMDRQGRPKQKGEPPGFVKISVRDTGIGIPKEKLPHIFDRFYQAEGLKEKGQQGTGIGLALTREIVLLHHGKIDVHSQEGKGTEFVIRLPMGHDHLKPEEIASSTGTVPELKKNKEVETIYMITEEDREEEDFEIEKDTTREDKTEEQGKNVILVVEDDADVRKYIRGPLEPGYTVVEAADGKQGIAKAREVIPDLIVSDIMMPEVDGYELCRVLKKDVKTSHIPIVLLTAKASEENVIQGLETGADDYITKPFNTKILLTRIKNLIDLRCHLQQKIQKQMLLQPAEISVSSVDQEFIKEVQDIIEKNLSDPEFHVGQLSEKLYMNRVTLYRKILALTGESPTDFIRSYRLKRAAQLLRDNFGNVSEVALAVGFSNLGYFTRCFKEKFHQLPSTYQASEA